MPANDEATKNTVLGALQNDRFNWRTIPGIAKETGLDAPEVTAAIAALGNDVVKASVRSRDGNDLYTARARYEMSGSIADKLRGAFINRIA